MQSRFASTLVILHLLAMVKLILSLALPTSLLSCLVSAEPRVLSMDYRRESHSAIGKRDPVNVPLQNHKNLYSVQVGIGTPPQNTSLQIDTGSTVTFALAPGACVDGNQCQPSCKSELIPSIKHDVRRSDCVMSEGAIDIVMLCLVCIVEKQLILF